MIRLWTIWALLAIGVGYYVARDPAVVFPVLLAWSGGIISTQIAERRRRERGDAVVRASRRRLH